MHKPCNITFNDILTAMKMICKEDESIIFTAEQKSFQNHGASEVRTNLATHADIIRQSSTQEEYFLKLEQQMSDENITMIEEATQGQSVNDKWHYARKHVVTASRAHSIKTRMETASKSATPIDFTNIIKNIEGTQWVNEDIPALKYGREMELEAVSTFTETYKGFHKKVKITECGLSICKDLRFAGGSPDRMVSCCCCGMKDLEVKCPYSIQHLSPLDDDANLPFLVSDADKKLSLKRNHLYYTHCQVQMAATGVESSIFFVWTTHGSHMELIGFDKGYWESLKALINDFYRDHYIPYIFEVEH